MTNLASLKAQSLPIKNQSPKYSQQNAQTGIDDIASMYWQLEQAYSCSDDYQSQQRNDDICEHQQDSIKLLATKQANELKQILTKMDVWASESFGEYKDHYLTPVDALALSILNDIKTVLSANEIG